jgi:hypothetical protein
MQYRLAGVERRRWLISSVLGAIFLVAACGGSKEGKPSPRATGGASAGVGGVSEAVPLAGKAGSTTVAGGGAAAEDPCADTPPGSLALIDDFDDGDTVAAPEPNREAYWFLISDESAGKLEPAIDFLPTEGGYRGSKGAHVSASGFDIWGAALVANISHETGVRCPFNASRFAGLRFAARGSGRVRVQLAMPEVVDKEFGGKCDPSQQACYDHHGTFVTLSDDFTIHELPWSSLTQRQFGEAVAFNPATIMSLYFSMEAANLPVDMWIDQVELWDGVPSSGAGGAGGAGGASDSEGDAGGTATGEGGTGGAWGSEGGASGHDGDASAGGAR